MKKLLFVALTLFFAAACFAQTQRGYVKTKGRMVDGKLVPGEGLKGAVVAVKGRTPVLVNKESGEFSFPMRDEQFSFDSVKKKGYQLVDADACTRTYKYSSNPIYFVMETPEQQLQDKLNAERKIRRNLQKQLQEREDEIENLKAEQKLTDEEYRQALQKLYQDQESNEQLISDMAKRYSELDYDQLDEFYRQVSYFIENGELTKADSLLNTRGDVVQQIEQEKQKGQAIHEQKRKIKKAEAVHAANIDELAKRCYSYYENFAAQHMNDTAAYYLELRANLDTTNITWQNAVGDFIRDFIADYDKALNYYQVSLRQTLSQFGDEYSDLVLLYNNIGYIYGRQGNYDQSLDCYNKSLNINKKIYGDENSEIALSYINIGAIYDDLGNYDKALEYYNMALIILENDVDKSYYLATLYNNIGVIYKAQELYDKALEYHNKSLYLRKQTGGEDNFYVGMSYNNIGTIYSVLNDYEKALEYYNKALELYKKVLGLKHPMVAYPYNNIGVDYFKQGYYDKALEYYNIALDIWENTYGNKNIVLSASYENIGYVYETQGNYTFALEYYQKCYEIRKSILGEDHQNTQIAKEGIIKVQQKLKESPKK